MMDPQDFIRLSIGSLGLRIPVSASDAVNSASLCRCEIRLRGFPVKIARVPLISSSEANPDPHSSPTVFYLEKSDVKELMAPGCFKNPKPFLEVAVYLGRRKGSNCSVTGRKQQLGTFRVDVSPEWGEGKPSLIHNGWIRIGKHKLGAGRPGPELHLRVKLDPDPRYVFQFEEETLLSPQIVQLQGTIRQPIFSCKFSRDRRSSQLDPLGSYWSASNGEDQDGERRERKGWKVMIHDLSGSAAAAAFMSTPFVPSTGCDRVARSNPGAWLIVRPDPAGASESWHPWGRLEAWRETGARDSVCLRLFLLPEGQEGGVLVSEVMISADKGGDFFINMDMQTPVGTPVHSPNGGGAAEGSGAAAEVGGFVMNCRVQGEGKGSKPLVQLAMRHVTCVEDAAIFMALAAAVDLSIEAWPQPPLSFSDRMMPVLGGVSNDDDNDAIDIQFSRSSSQNSRLTKPKQAVSSKGGTTKVSEVSTLLGRAGTVGLGKAVDVLDTLGSSMTSLNLNSGFVSGVMTKGIKISILAFEVANTVVKGANLMHSLSKENIKHVKEVVLPSEGVKHLISKDMDELLRMAAADKREELRVFAGEVVRFGNRCKDPQWHNLDRYFDKLESELTPLSKFKEEAEAVMQQLMTTVQYTAELYHELHALDRFEQDYRRKLQEEDAATTVQRGDNLQILRQELKSQRKHVKSLKKKSLWSNILEEVMKKLVDIVHFLHLEIHDAFGSADGDKPVRISTHQRLGSAGLALHYANIINQIDTLVSRSTSVPQNTKDSLYQGLPPSIKSALRTKLQSFYVEDELTGPQIKAEMEKTLRWLVPIAANTTKAHHGFGWVGEWANTGTELNRKATGQTDLIRIETLHHADKEKTEAYILDLVVWLHHLVSHTKGGNVGIRSPIKSPIRSPTKSFKVSLSGNKPNDRPSSMLTKEDQEMLADVSSRKLTPGISKSQEFDTGKCRSGKKKRLTKSSSASHSPESGSKKELFPVRRPSMRPVIDFDIDRIKALDVIDRVDTLRKL